MLCYSNRSEATSAETTVCTMVVCRVWLFFVGGSMGPVWGRGVSKFVQIWKCILMYPNSGDRNRISVGLGCPFHFRKKSYFAKYVRYQTKWTAAWLEFRLFLQNTSCEIQFWIVCERKKESELCYESLQNKVKCFILMKRKTRKIPFGIILRNKLLVKFRFNETEDGRYSLWNIKY